VSWTGYPSANQERFSARLSCFSQITRYHSILCSADYCTDRNDQNFQKYVLLCIPCPGITQFTKMLLYTCCRSSFPSPCTSARIWHSLIFSNAFTLGENQTSEFFKNSEVLLRERPRVPGRRKLEAAVAERQKTSPFCFLFFVPPFPYPISLPLIPGIVPGSFNQRSRRTRKNGFFRPGKIRSHP